VPTATQQRPRGRFGSCLMTGLSVHLAAAVIFGVAFSPIAHDTALLYPLIPVLNKFSKKHDVDVQTAHGWSVCRNDHGAVISGARPRHVRRG